MSYKTINILAIRRENAGEDRCFADRLRGARPSLPRAEHFSRNPNDGTQVPFSVGPNIKISTELLIRAKQAAGCRDFETTIQNSALRGDFLNFPRGQMVGDY